MNSKMLRAAACGVPLVLAACQKEASLPPRPTAVIAQVIAYERDPTGAESPYPVEAAPRYATAMAFRVAGKLIERRVRLGDRVRKGAVLARLDGSDAERQTASAAAALDAAEHRLMFAKQQLDRDERQSAQNLIAANQLEQTQDAYVAALAARDQARAQRVIAGNTESYFTLVAEHDGVISSEDADTGQVLTAGQTVYGLAWTGETDVTLDAGAADLSQVSVGQAAQVRFTALPGRQYAAKVREMAPAADPQNRTYRVKLTLQDAPSEVRFGMTGEAAFLPNRQPGAVQRPLVTIPATALFHQDKAPAVWVIRSADSTLELRPVKVERYRERSVLIDGRRELGQGLDPGEQIVSAGVHTVFAGEKVTPVTALFAGDTP